MFLAGRGALEDARGGFAACFCAAFPTPPVPDISVYPVARLFHQRVWSPDHFGGLDLVLPAVRIALLRGNGDRLVAMVKNVDHVARDAICERPSLLFAFVGPEFDDDRDGLAAALLVTDFAAEVLLDRDVRHGICGCRAASARPLNLH